MSNWTLHTVHPNPLLLGRHSVEAGLEATDQHHREDLMDPSPEAVNTRADRDAGPGVEDLWFRKRVDTSHYASPSTYPPCTCGAKVCPDRSDDSAPHHAISRNEYR